MDIKIKDSKPEVGIFELVEGQLLIDGEEVSRYGAAGDFFSGTRPHLHAQDIKTLVKYNPSISAETKAKFEKDPREYLRYLRGRVDYNVKTGQYHIMSSRSFFTQENIEMVTRAFHLPPYASGQIVLEADEGHYGVL